MKLTQYVVVVKDHTQKTTHTTTHHTKNHEEAAREAFKYVRKHISPTNVYEIKTCKEAFKKYTYFN